MYFPLLCGRVALLCVLFALAAAAQQTALVVSPTDLGLAVQARSTTPATGVIAVATPGRNVPFTASVRHLGGSDTWLTVSPTSGTTPANVTVSADGSRLAPGTYLAQVAFSAGGIGRVVNVSLAVGSTSGSVFGVSPSSLTFVAAPGATTLPTQVISVTSPGLETGFTATATSSGWLTVAPISGRTPAVLVVEVHAAGLSGQHTGAIAITPAAGGPATIVPVTLIAAGTAPADRLRTSQTLVTVNYQTGQTASATRDVTVYANEARLFTASTEQSWIRVSTTFSPARGTETLGFTPDTLSIHVDPTASGVTTGKNSGVVLITADGVEPIAVEVVMEIADRPVLNAQPSSVVLNSTLGFSRSVVVTSTSSTLSFNAIASTVSGGDWLSVTPASGTTAGTGQTLIIAANTGGLKSGTYIGRVVLAAQNGSTFSIPVQLDVEEVTTGSVLFASPISLVLNATPGGLPPVEVLNVAVQGGAALDFTASAVSDGGWLIVDPTAARAPARLRVTADLAKLPAAGPYVGMILLTTLPSGEQLSVVVTLNLLDETLSVEPGTLSFVPPRRGAEAPPQTIAINSGIPARFEVVDKPVWIRMSQYLGSTPARVQVWPEISAVPPGTNTGVIRIAGPRNTVSVNVSFREADPQPATVAPESVTLRYRVGEPTLPVQVLEVASGGEAGTFRVAVKTESGVDWLRATPLTGSTPGRVQLSVDPLLLAPGSHAATVTVSVNNGVEQTRTIPVVLMVGAPTALVSSVTHSATQAPTAVAPGQMITILGSGLGPLLAIAPRPTAAGAYETRIGDTRVLFDNTPAPILYLRNDQINAVVPYAVYGRASTTMRIEQGSNWSLPLELRVVDAAPGIFTANGSGRGPASAANADSSANSAANPAARGSVVTFYVTGEGQTDPPGNDGRVIFSDVRRPLLPVAVRIGGRPAEVVYAGSAPMQVSGMMQVNARVPEDSPTGVVALEVQVGSAVSQTGVTIAVR